MSSGVLACSPCCCRTCIESPTTAYNWRWLETVSRFSVADSRRLLTPLCRWLIAHRLWICTIFWSRKSHGKSVLKKRGHFVCDIWLTVCHDAVYMLVSVCPSSPSNDDWRIRRNIIRIVLCWTEYYGCALIRTHVFEPLLQMDVGLGLFMLKFVCYFASLNRSSLFVRVSFCVFQ